MKPVDKIFLIGGMIIIFFMVIYFTIFSIIPLPKSIESERVVTGVWREGALPVGYPVIGLWSVDGEIICEPCIQTDFAGIYEYSPVANPSRPLTPPDYWIDMPRRNP